MILIVGASGDLGNATAVQLLVGGEAVRERVADVTAMAGLAEELP